MAKNPNSINTLQEYHSTVLPLWLPPSVSLQNFWQTKHHCTCTLCMLIVETLTNPWRAYNSCYTGVANLLSCWTFSGMIIPVILLSYYITLLGESTHWPSPLTEVSFSFLHRPPSSSKVEKAPDTWGTLLNMTGLWCAIKTKQKTIKQTCRQRAQILSNWKTTFICYRMLWL